VQFTVDKNVLADAVAWTARSLPARPTAPVLAGLLMEATTNQVTLSGFDLEVSTQVTMKADVESPGRALVSGRLLSDITRALPSLPVIIENDGARVSVTCGSSKFVLLTLPVQDYPSLPDMPTVTGKVEGAAFTSVVQQVTVAAGRDDTLPALTGIRMEIEGDRLLLAATDRYRLAVGEVTWQPEGPAVSATALIPARTLAETARAMAGAEHVEIAFSAREGAVESLVGFAGDGRRTTTRLIDGEFPKYKALFPDTTETTATVEKSTLVDAVKRVALVAERNAPIRLNFSTKGVLLEAGTGDEAQAVESLEAEVNGPDITIAFNPQYLVDGLGAVPGESVTISFIEARKPAVITAAGESTTGSTSTYRYLLMPVRMAG